MRTYRPRRLAPFLSILFLLGASSAATQPGLTPATADSSSPTVSTDSLKSDSVKVHPPLTNAFLQLADTNAIVRGSSFEWISPRSLGDIVGQSPGVYLRDPSSSGQYLQLNFRGIDWRGISVTADGRPLNDPASGVFNPYGFTLDFVDRAEITPGPRGFLYGVNSTGGSINLVTKHFDNNRPTSKILYSEGAHGYGYFDGSISQNVTGSMNVVVGLQRQITDGRFANSAHESWISRERVRYRFSDHLSMVLSHSLTSTKTQLNGGLDSDPQNLANAFFPIQTAVTNEDSYEKLNRNDVDLSLVGFFVDDSTSPTRLSLYYSNNFREYRDENGGFIPNNVFIQSDHTSSWMGAIFTQTLEGEVHRFSLRSNLELRQIEGSPNLGRRRNVIGSVDAIDEIRIGNIATVAAYGRYDRYLDKDYTGFGADANIRVTTGMTLFGGGSFSWRLPTYQELYWVDSTVHRNKILQEEEHTHIEAGLKLADEEMGMLRAAYFHRRVVSPILLLPYGTGFVFPGILFTNGDELINQGVDLRLWFRWWHLYIEANGTYIVRNSNAPTVAEYPELSVTGGVYIWERLIGGHLHLRAGFQARYQSAQTGTAFNPEVLAYIKNPATAISGGSAVDFVLVGRIGDAYVHFIWENLTESEYFATPYYPVRDRAIRFGISWQFLD